VMITATRRYWPCHPTIEMPKLSHNQKRLCEPTEYPVEENRGATFSLSPPKSRIQGCRHPVHGRPLCYYQNPGYPSTVSCNKEHEVNVLNNWPFLICLVSIIENKRTEMRIFIARLNAHPTVRGICIVMSVKGSVSTCD